MINVVSKSGTNQFHGSVFEYFRNDVLTANDFFSNRSGKARPALRYNQFGAAVGGPIIKNRTFFFFAYEGLREGIPTVVTTSVPTALQRAGNFSQTLAGNGQLVTIFDPFSTKPDPNNPGSIFGRLFRQHHSYIQDRSGSREHTMLLPGPTSPGDPDLRVSIISFLAGHPLARRTIFPAASITS